jgi:hypothetical protein
MLVIKLYWNKYKGNGKAWLAKKTNENLVFLQQNSFRKINWTKSGGIYEGVKSFIIDEDGEYIAEEVYTGTYSIRHFFTVEKGKIKNIRTVYANGFHQGEELKPNLVWEEMELMKSEV